MVVYIAIAARLNHLDNLDFVTIANNKLVRNIKYRQCLITSGLTKVYDISQCIFSVTIHNIKGGFFNCFLTPPFQSKIASSLLLSKTRLESLYQLN